MYTLGIHLCMNINKINLPLHKFISIYVSILPQKYRMIHTRCYHWLFGRVGVERKRGDYWFFLIYLCIMSLVSVKTKKYKRANKKAFQEEVSFSIWEIWEASWKRWHVSRVFKKREVCWERPAKDYSQHSGQLCQAKKRNGIKMIMCWAPALNTINCTSSLLDFPYRWGNWGSEKLKEWLKDHTASNWQS